MSVPSDQTADTNELAVELDYNELDERLKINFLILQQALKNSQDLVNDLRTRVYTLENP